jgi:nitroreductase
MTAVDDPVLRAIFDRRVTRSMSNRPVDPDSLSLILRAARSAPNAGNRRLQPVVPVTDPATLRRLRSVSPGMIARPTAAVVVCIDVARAEEYGFAPDAPGLLIDVGTAMATVLLAAYAVGVGAVPVSSFSRVAVGRILGLPATTVPRIIVCLGHPTATQPPPMPGPAAGADAHDETSPRRSTPEPRDLHEGVHDD